MTTLLFDFRLAFRSLVRRRAYAAMVIVILGLGIGANSAIFGVVDAVLLRSLPYDRPESLVVVFADGTARNQGPRVATTVGDYIDWRDRQGGAFSGLAALRNESRRITTVDAPVVPLVHAVSANYFDVLGARPVVGRSFVRGEDQPGRDDVVMLSYGLWQSVFGGDRAIVGKTIGLDGRPHTVVGIMGQDFYSAHIFAVQPGLWVPAPFDQQRDDRAVRDVVVYGRLAASGAAASAQASMRELARRMAGEHPATNDGWSVALVPLRDHVVGSFSRTATMLLAAVGLVLVIACANVANLALARGMERASDVAVRTALGASRARIVSQLLSESLVLASLGGTVGALVAWAGIPTLVHLIPTGAGVPFLHRVAIDGRVLMFTGLMSIACAVLSGLLPSRQASRLDVVAGLRQTGRGAIMTAARRWKDVLVVAEVALAVVVVVAATLMWRTLDGLQHVPTGFNPAGIAKLRTSLRGEAFDTPAARVRHFEELQRRLEAMPNVASVSAVSFEPPIQAGLAASVRLRVPGLSEDPASAPSAVGRVVMADYFETMQIPIVAGRSLSRRDRFDTARVAVISQAMARRYFAGVNPIGRTFTIDLPRALPFEIVGIVGDVLSAGLDPSPQPAFYVPYQQNPILVMTVVMRVRGDAAAVLATAERIAWSVSPSTNVYAVETMERYLRELNWRPRFAAVILGGFAVLGLALAAAGLYAVVSSAVLQRRAEIGLRMALGAARETVVGMVLKDGMRPVLIGLAVGDISAIVLTKSMRGLLYGVAPGDPMTLALASVGLFVLAASACFLPAVAASRLDPLTALRE